MTSSSYPDDGLGELFVKMSKQGSTLAGVMDAFSIAISIALQYGVPLETYVSKFVNMRFDPAGMTDDPDIRIASSVMDYLFRRLALDYLPYEKRAELGIFTAEERAAVGSSSYGAGAETESPTWTSRRCGPRRRWRPTTRRRTSRRSAAAARPAPPEAHSSTELLELQQGTVADAPLCFPRIYSSPSGVYGEVVVTKRLRPLGRIADLGGGSAEALRRGRSERRSLPRCACRGTAARRREIERLTSGALPTSAPPTCGMRAWRS